MGLVNRHHNSVESSVGTGALTRRPQLTAVMQSQLSQVDFLNRLFQALEESSIRYCVLQRWDALLEELHTDHDVDLAVHPKDAEKLPPVWGALMERGYRPIHLLNHEVNAYAFVFAWFEGLSLRTVMVDIAFDHRQSGLIWKSGEELIAGRQRRGIVWAADPGVELAYLLVKKMLKGSFKASREQRYKLLVERVGRPRAKKIITDLFGERSGDGVLAACENAHLGPILRSLRKSFLLKRFVRNPINLVRYVVADALRLGRRWFQPTGLSLALLVTKGVRDNNDSERLVEILTPAFGIHNVRWRRHRPKPEHSNDAAAQTTDSENYSGPVGLIFGLLTWFLSLWLGYALRIRPLVVRTHLVVLDRYFPDGLVDPSFVNFKSLMWLARLLSFFAPKPDLLLFLDGREENTLPSECEIVERGWPLGAVAARQFVQSIPRTRLLRSNPRMDQSVREASQSVLDHLAVRFQNRHGRWLGLSS